MTATPRETLDDILEGVGCAYERRVPLGPLTWYGVGGSAQRLAHPADAEELAALARACHSSQTPIRVLGKGANLIVVEGDVPGVVVQLDGLKQVAIDPPTGLVTAGGGADLEKLITLTVREGLGGLEALAGIPATIGGALRMNAGGAFGSIGPLVESVSIVETDGSRITLRRDELEFTYRRSNLTGRIVAEAVFRLDRVSDCAALRDRLKEVMRYKKASQPMAASSAGCAFKNPPKEVSEKGAGRLIDEAGLKGLRFGGAEVSRVHANFIVLHKGGMARDVLELMNRVQLGVRERFGIELEREVVVWG